MKQTILIFILAFLTTTCGDRPNVSDDHSPILKDSLTANSDIQPQAKKPDDWSAYYYCDNLDTAIKYFDKVHHLSLRNYDIKTLPIEITKLSKVEDIGFYWCKNFNWSDVFTKVSKINTLKGIEISECCVKKLPKEIGKLKQITRFFCGRDTCLTNIPKEISNLEALTDLSFWGDFQVFPRQILGIKNLSNLNLSFCNLNELPEDIDKLENLDTLELYANNLKTFPKNIVNMKNLRLIYFDENPIKDSLKYIGKLKEKLPNCAVMNYTTPFCANSRR